MDLPTEPSGALIWREEPHFRGTFAILTSCVGTLLVCTWSALHDDIPHGKSKIRRRLHQCVWLVMSLLAPELLLLIAFDQFWTAYNLTKDGQRWLPSEQGRSGNVQVSPPLSLCNETSVHCTHSQHWTSFDSQRFRNWRHTLRFRGPLILEMPSQIGKMGPKAS